MDNYGRPGGINLPPVIKNLLLINVVVYLFQILSTSIQFGEVNIGEYFHDIFALHPIRLDNLFNSTDSFWPWQLVSYQFMHSFSFFHILFNMYGLYLFGSFLEQSWGSRKFLAFYLLCGIGGGILQLTFGGNAMVIGASGSVFGLIAGLATVHPNQTIFMFPFFIPIKLKWLAIILVCIDVLSVVFGVTGNTAYFAHIGGAVSGYVLVKYAFDSKLFPFVYSIFDLFKPKQSYSSKSSFSQQGSNVHKMYSSQRTYSQQTRTYTEPQANPKTYNVQGEEITQRRIDEILDKISSSGYQNLTDKEKEILVELSKKVK
jgi:membrane associated rhomboid family serine protease